MLEEEARIAHSTEWRRRLQRRITPTVTARCAIPAGSNPPYDVKMRIKAPDRPAGLATDWLLPRRKHRHTLPAPWEKPWSIPAWVSGPPANSASPDHQRPSA